MIRGRTEYGNYQNHKFHHHSDLRSVLLISVFVRADLSLVPAQGQQENEEHKD